jgi:carboxyl-terminal processing protease
MLTKGATRMALRIKIGVLAVSVVVAFYIIVGGLLPRYGVIASNNDPYSQLTIFQEVLSRIVSDYVDEPDLEKVRVGALRGLAEGLDPYSAYVSPAQVKRMTTGAPSGEGESGLIVSKVAGYLYVVSVIPESPAASVGLRAGDVIEFVGAKATRDMSLYEARDLLVGPVGTPVELKVFRGGRSETFKFRLEALRPRRPEAKMLESRVGYLKLGSLQEGEADLVRSELGALGNRGVDRLILDLRGVATGTLSEAVKIANFFVGKGVLVKTLGREGRVRESIEADPRRVVFDKPLVVLIDRSTAGPAEVIAAAIGENKRGELVGERTFGSGGEQQLFRLRDGGALYITTLKYASPTGRAIMGQTAATSGVAPSVEVRRPDGTLSPEELEEREELLPTEQREQRQPAAPPEDIQLKKALEIIRLK